MNNEKNSNLAVLVVVYVADSVVVREELAGVDDVVVVMALVNPLVQEAGGQVHVAQGGQQQHRQLRQEQMALIICTLV